MHTNPSYILGLGRYDHENKKHGTEDSEAKELRHMLCLLQTCNTHAIELLYCKDWIKLTSPWEEVIAQRRSLVDRDRFYRSVGGYLVSEKRASLGITTAKLGDKRKTLIEEFGYSPKNAAQCLRLAWAGTWFLKYGHFPVNVRQYDVDFADLLVRIKSLPQEFTSTQISTLMNEKSDEFEKAFLDNTAGLTRWDGAVANRLCVEIYRKLI